MHLTKKGGVTPCDRRFDRGKVAIAAAAALLLFATAAQAQPPETLIINPTLSSITFGETINLAALGFPGDDGHGNYVAVNQLGQAGSMTTHYSGALMLDTSTTPGAIQLLPNGSQINALNNGVWFPGENPNGSVGTPTIAGGTVGPAPGNYGFQFTSLGVLGNTNHLILNILPLNQDLPIGAPNGLGNAPMTLSGNNFNLAGQALVATDGLQETWGPAAAGGPTQSTLDDIASIGATDYGLAIPLVAGTGTWDGTTLTIPIISTQTISASHGTILITSTFSGTIVATVQVPEPSTMTLFGFGVVGLLSYAWRARKRRSLVA